MASDCSDSRSTLVPRGPGTSGIISRRKARRRMQSLDSRNRKNVLRAVNTDYPCYVRASHARLRPDPQRLARDLLVSIRRYPMAIFVAFHLHSTAKQHKGSRMGDVISSLFFLQPVGNQNSSQQLQEEEGAVRREKRLRSGRVQCRSADDVSICKCCPNVSIILLSLVSLVIIIRLQQWRFLLRLSLFISPRVKYNIILNT